MTEKGNCGSRDGGKSYRAPRWPPSILWANWRVILETSFIAASIDREDMTSRGSAVTFGNEAREVGIFLLLRVVAKTW